MYRPNRIGPWPLVHVDQVPLALSINANAPHTDVDFEPMVTDETIRALTHSEQFSVTFPSIADNLAGSIGISINGAHPTPDNPENGIMLAVHMSIECNDEVQLVANLGRSDAATIVAPATGPSVCTNFMQIPSTQFSAAKGTSLQLNTCLIVGNFSADYTYDDAPLILGVTLINRSGGALTSQLIGSMSMYKYVFDLDTFDPGRI